MENYRTPSTFIKQTRIKLKCVFSIKHTRFHYFSRRIRFKKILLFQFAKYVIIELKINMMKSSTSGCSRKYWKASHDRTDINVPYLLNDNECLIIVRVFNSQTFPITCKIAIIKILTTLKIKIHILVKTRYLYTLWDTSLYSALYIIFTIAGNECWPYTSRGILSYYDFSVEDIRRFQCACQLMNEVDGKCECPRD